MVRNKKRVKRDLTELFATFGQGSTVAENSLLETSQTDDLLVEKTACRFGANERLLFDLDAALRVFDVSNKSANLFFFHLLQYCERNGEETICFCQPTIEAYKASLRLCNAVTGNETLQTAFNDFTESHTLGTVGDWVQDLPLWRVYVYDGETEAGYAIGNAIQTAIFCGYWSAKNPDVKCEVVEHK